MTVTREQFYDTNLISRVKYCERQYNIRKIFIENPNTAFTTKEIAELVKDKKYGTIHQSLKRLEAMEVLEQKGSYFIQKLKGGVL